MDKEKILSKITPKDYHNELEIILEDKDFSEDVKNLLLSCVYKIEAGYHDYETVKRETLSKKEYLEEIITIIDKKCKSIEIVKEDLTNIEDEEKSRYEIDRLEGKITIWHPNEKMLLYAIYELDDNQIYVDEKYSLIRTSLSELLNKGENMNRLEVLRDFNGWNWNTDPNEIQNITYNLVYQNLIDLLGTQFMEQWIHTEKIKDYLALAKDKVISQYGIENAEILFKWISKLALIICISDNSKEKEYLLQEKQEAEEQLERLKNKNDLLEEISENEKEALVQIKEIDTILSDKTLLEQEYIKRNEALPEYHKIFSLSHLTEILTRQRKKIMAKIEEENKLLEPVYYLEVKAKLEEKLELLSDLDLKKEEIDEKITYYSIQLEKKVMDCFKIRINNIEKLEKSVKKEALIKEIYSFRYYSYLYLDKNRYIGIVEELQEKTEEIKRALIKKAEELKVLNKIAKEGRNFDIFNILFTTRIINLENIGVELQDNINIEALIYETDIFEKKIVLQLSKRDLNVKLDKKIKLIG